MALALTMNSYARDANRVVGAGQGARTHERGRGRRSHQEMPSFHGRCSLVSFVAGFGPLVPGACGSGQSTAGGSNWILRVEEVYALICSCTVVVGVAAVCASEVHGTSGPHSGGDRSEAVYHVLPCARRKQAVRISIEHRFRNRGDPA